LKPASTNKLRIIGGNLRGSRLDFPDLPGLRPTSDRIRETLFNWLQGSIRGSNCLDLFAGSGAVGFEAISRGAEQVCFVEKSELAANTIRENLQRLKITNAEVLEEDARESLLRFQIHNQKFDVIFLDPPFSEQLIPSICNQLEESNVMADGCKIYIESGEKIDIQNLSPSWVILKEKKAGVVNYCLFAYTK
jgi:16S rRNA (guanine966-N2)-methyltransferase